MSNEPILFSSDKNQAVIKGGAEDSRVLVRSRTSSSSSSGLSLKPSRTARFAEATSVNSPIDPSTTGRSPFADPQSRTTHLMPQPQPSDVGFGYVADNQPSKHSSFVGVEVPLTPTSPLKSALKVPGTPGRQLNPLSPTFREEQILEKHEEKAEKENAKDLVRRYVSWTRFLQLLTFISREPKPVYAWQRCASGVSISAAVSSWCR